MNICTTAQNKNDFFFLKNFVLIIYLCGFIPEFIKYDFNFTRRKFIELPFSNKH